MLGEEQSTIHIPSGLPLRTELSLRGLYRARSGGYLHERTDGSVPGILFGRDAQGRHGNFHPESYRNICACEPWAARLQKVHTAYRRMRPRCNWEWRELDCANSSDALLMNIFCYPNVLAGSRIQTMLSAASSAQPEFGFKPRTPLHNDKRDNTEVDMKLGALLIEAKLTESDFQWARPALVARYRDLESVFDVGQLPLRNGRHESYQLIRGTLAAHATGCSFCVVADARRPDLIEAWFKILRAVRPAELRCRLQLLTWQELSIALPSPLRQFLSVKYGIHP